MSLYSNFIYEPLYNALVFLIDLAPFLDIGLAVIIFTCIVKFILFPLSKKAITTQVNMKRIEPKLKEIRTKYANDQKKQAEEMLNLYKTEKVNPFSSIIVLIVQVPIVWALYSVVVRSGLPVINESMLYSFVSAPVIDMNFLGILNVGAKSIVLAILAGITQYFQIKFSFSQSLPQTKQGVESKDPITKPDFQEEFTKSMSTSMKYVFPVMMIFLAYGTTAAGALYFITSNLFTLIQEIIIRKQLNR